MIEGMNHEYFKDRVSAYHDGELKHEEERMIAEHIQGCEECQKLLSDLDKLDRMISEHSGLSESEYWEKSAQRIESALGSGDETEVVEVRKGSYRGLWWKVGALAASAAVIVIIAVYQGDISHKVLDENNSGSVPRQRKAEIQLKV
ncbi:MAG TPA: zf-HC2 domain-containing protein, partial [candidate division Zixibacteria bacterium]|nr:zf-HC2 domain-containing protein [candidate division Zixibacteria bacterium]